MGRLVDRELGRASDKREEGTWEPKRGQQAGALRKWPLPSAKPMPSGVARDLDGLKKLKEALGWK